MARCEEWANFEELPPMVGKEGSERAVNGKEPVASWFLERCLAKDGQETSVDLVEFLTPKMDKAKAKLTDGERKRFSGAAAETAVDKIQTEKMDKAKHAAVKASGGEKRRFSIIPKGSAVEKGKAAASMDKIQTEKVHKGASSEQLAGVKGGKHRIPDEYLSLILAMPRERPLAADIKAEEMLFDTEERRQLYREGEARSERIYGRFLQFQNRVRDEFLEKGYVEVDHDYRANMAKVEEEDRAMWEESRKKRDPILRFASRSDPGYAEFYATSFDPVKQARSLLSDAN